MFKHYTRKYGALIGAVSVIVTLEALTNGIRKDDYCVKNTEPDIPTGHYFTSLPYIDFIAVGTSSIISGNRVNL